MGNWGILRACLNVVRLPVGPKNSNAGDGLKKNQVRPAGKKQQVARAGVLSTGWLWRWR